MVATIQAYKSTILLFQDPEPGPRIWTWTLDLNLEKYPPAPGCGNSDIGGRGGVSGLREVPSELGIGMGSGDITLFATNWVAIKDLDT